MPEDIPRGDTLVDVFDARVLTTPERTALIFLENGEDVENVLTYADLGARARCIAAALQRLGSTGERALLLFNPGIDYVCAYVGCLYAGWAPVPAYPPDPSRLERTLPRIQGIIGESKPRAVLTTSAIAAMAGPLIAALAPDAESIAVDQLPREMADAWRRPEIGPDTIALVQYTSGSTGDPKGALISHGNLLSNLMSIRHTGGPQQSGISWLPPYHDMGLIGGILHPLHLGFRMTLMSPFDFLKRPVRWVRAMSKYAATMSVAPNFAYALVARKVTPDDVAALDLSPLRALWNGAEPVRHDVLRTFATTFAPCGLSPRVFIPCYGLAEASLLVSGVPWDDEPRVTVFSRRSINDGAPVVAPPGDEDSVALVGCGPPAQDAEIRIVDPETKSEMPDGQVGEVWVRGSGIGGGYYGRPEASRETFGATLRDGTGPFLRTGDLGFMWNGELHIAGRIKDVIIIRGQNHHPSEIERTAEESHGALRRGCSAAFSVDLDGEERVVLIAELERRYIPDRRQGDGARQASSERRREEDRRQMAPSPGIDAPDPGPLDPERVVADVREAVARAHEVQIAVVCLVPPGSSFKTPSGKIQRSACRKAWLAGELAPIHESRI